MSFEVSAPKSNPKNLSERFRRKSIELFLMLRSIDKGFSNIFVKGRYLAVETVGRSGKEQSF